MNAPLCPPPTFPVTAMNVITRPFSNSGPYMPTAGIVSATIECWGPGGGGGGAIATTAVFPALGGGGGGSGGYSRTTVLASMVMGGVMVTIGVGGVGGIAAAGAGGDGTPTSFGAMCVANGGQGGTTAGPVGGNQTSGYGGAGAPAGVGDIAFAGTAGQTGGYALPSEEVEVVGGLGGAAPLGGGVAKEAATLAGTNVVAPGGPGMSPGAGGGGASSANPAATPSGGAGANGFCMVTEYVLAGSAANDCCQGQARVPAYSGWDCYDR
jgi:hypothetical protein